MEKVSIIVPVYNMSEHIESGVKCLTEQTYENLEIIIVDDGSKDDSYIKCLAEADKDKRVAVFSKNNEGPAAARNLALRKATGKYVYFFDADDYIERNAIEKLVNAMEEQKVDLVACSFSLYDGKRVYKIIQKAGGLRREGGEARRDYYEHMLMYGEKGLQGAAWYKLYKMDIIRREGIEFPPLRRNEDHVFVAGYVNYIDSLYILGDVLCRYYTNSYKRVWDKYAFDFFDTVRASTLSVAEIICGWNTDNIRVRNRIYEDYFHKSFGSLCALFNPKLKMPPKRRFARLREITDIYISDIPKENFDVNHRVFRYMKQKKYAMVYICIQLHLIRHKFD